MMRYDIINSYIADYGLNSYLEIGYYDGFCFDKISCNQKLAVDPNPQLIKETHLVVETSDDYFEGLSENVKFDFIFIDGLHHSDQVDKDIQNSLRHLSNGGFVMLHDTNPLDYYAQVIPRETKAWNGDVWKSVVKFRVSNNDYSVYTYNTDNGCTIITNNPKKMYLYSELNYDITTLSYNDLESNRNLLLNFI